jgi:uncharacterized membrane protein YjfL (UPF0719 family)
MLIKILLLILLLLAIASLFIGLFFVLRKDNIDQDKRTLYSLVARISFCTLALVILLVAFFNGNMNMNQSPEQLDKIAAENKQLVK